MWIFTSRIFRLALETNFLPNKYFFLQDLYKFLSQSKKLNKWGCPKKCVCVCVCVGVWVGGWVGGGGCVCGRARVGVCMCVKGGVWKIF